MMSLAARHAAIARPMPIASRARATTPSRASRVVVNAAGADRELWYPGAKAPKYLDGTMAGDYGAYRASHRAHKGENHRCADAPVAKIRNDIFVPWLLVLPSRSRLERRAAVRLGLTDGV